MIKEKFTPGTWELSDMSCHDAMDNYTVCFHIGKSDSGELIADLQSSNIADYEHVRANAYLIASAPVLYDMLNSLLNEEVYNLDQQTRENIAYELKKARGEQCKN